jgi:hypothetical protein
MASRNKILYLLLISLLFLSAWCHDEHSCRHDEIDQDADLLDIEEDLSSIQDGTDRVLASTSYPNLRIYPYYDYLGSSSFELYVKNELVPPLVSYFASALKVKFPVTGNLKLSSSVSKICDRSPPSILKSTGVAADLFIYYDTYATDEFVAYAGACYLASGTKRPIIAKTMINSNRMLNPNGDALQHERNLYTVMHETMHALGFDNYQFNNFLDANGKKRTGHVKSVQIAGKTRTVLDLPPLTEKLRNYYGCPTLQGAVMENDGGSGTANSHFETKYFLYDIMVSSSNFGRRVSEFSLAVLEGTGWYVPDYSYAEPFFYGQGQGCDFLSNTCSTSGTPKFDEYCTGSNRGCALQGRGGGPCTTSNLMENCRAYRTYDDYDCDNDDGADNARLPDLQAFGRGADSKCFTGTLNSKKSSNGATSFCFKYSCVGSGSNTQLEVQLGKNTITCTQEGQKTINGYYGSINCPDPLTFCNTVGKKYCPLNCAGRGTCVNGKCKCNQGASGIDCAMTI